MKKTLMTILVALLGACSSFAVQVLADGAVSTVNLQPGLYQIDAVGTYKYDTFDYAVADAEWLRSISYGWDEYPGADPTQRICDLTVNETFFDWLGKSTDGSYGVHTFSPSHEYRIQLELAGDTRLQIFDPWYYYDNSGSLEVTFTAVPEPATVSVLLFGGLLIWRRKNR